MTEGIGDRCGYLCFLLFINGKSRAPPAAENTGAKQLDVFFIKGKSRAPAADNTGAKHKQLDVFFY
jgi:hypothetical protein